MSSDIEEAIAYSDKCWEKVNKKYYKFQDALINYRKTFTAKRKSDMWYLGYMLAGQHFQKEDIGIDEIVEAIREGYEESKLTNGGQK